MITRDVHKLIIGDASIHQSPELWMVWERNVAYLAPNRYKQLLTGQHKEPTLMKLESNYNNLHPGKHIWYGMQNFDQASMC